MIDQARIGEEIVKGSKDVFSTMLMVDLEDEAALINQRLSLPSNLSSMIGLGGGIRGVLAIHCPASVAKSITSSFLGMEVDELNEDVKDAIGEIANMVAGNLKISFADEGIDIELAIPTSVVGEGFNVCGAAKAQRVLVPLKMQGMPFWIELMYVLN